MTDTVFIALPGVGTLELSREQYEAALRPLAPVRNDPPPVSEPLLDAGEMARLVNLPKSCVYEKARTGAIPSIRVGKHVRFNRSAVLAALSPTAQGAVGRV